jgi:hypothetical protein
MAPLKASLINVILTVSSATAPMASQITKGVFNATGECAAATNPLVRVFKAARHESMVPLYELGAPAAINWTEAAPNVAYGALLSLAA